MGVRIVLFDKVYLPYSEFVFVFVFVFVFAMEFRDLKSHRRLIDIYREQIPVHPSGLIVHPPLLTCTPPRGNLKFPLRITQLHTKFSRQFKGLHMILSNLFMIFPTALNSVNLA